MKTIILALLCVMACSMDEPKYFWETGSYYYADANNMKLMECQNADACNTGKDGAKTNEADCKEVKIIGKGAFKYTRHIPENSRLYVFENEDDFDAHYTGEKNKTKPQMKSNYIFYNIGCEVNGYWEVGEVQYSSNIKKTMSEFNTSKPTETINKSETYCSKICRYFSNAINQLSNLTVYETVETKPTSYEDPLLEYEGEINFENIEEAIAYENMDNLDFNNFY